jgi:hypothetical protein
VKIYFKGFSITETLLIAFRTDYKRVSLFIKSRVAYATGEVSFFKTNNKGDGRGSVVPILQVGKGPKHFVRLDSISHPTRSYITKSGINSSTSASLSLFSSLPTDSCLKSGFVTGLSDAYGSLTESINTNPEYRNGIIIRASFQIQVNERNHDLLKLLQESFERIGSINGRAPNCIIFRVYSREDLSKYIIPHFDKYPPLLVSYPLLLRCGQKGQKLITHKKEDFELFKSIIDKMNNRDNLTSDRIHDGIQEILNISSSLNLGFSEDLRVAYPNNVPVPRRLVDEVIPDPH